MNRIVSLLIAFGSLAANLAAQDAAGTAFAYHGQLTHDGQPAAGSYDLRAGLFAALAGGAQIGSTLTNLSVAINGGRFATPLDFGAGAFNGEARFLEIAVRPAGQGEFVPLNPRQPITPAPYALFAMTPAGPQGMQGIQGPPGLQGPTGASGPTGSPGPRGLTWLGDWLEATVYAPDDGVQFEGSSWVALLKNTASKPGTRNANWSLLAQEGEAGPQGPTGAQGLPGPQGAQGAQGDAGETGPQGPAGPAGPPGATDGWSLTGNAGTTPGESFLGTSDSAPLILKAGAQQVVRYEGQASGLRIIAGRDNSIDGNSTNSAVLSGRENSIAGQAHESVIAGGVDNVIARDQRSAVIGGGARNEIRQDNQHAAILGGRDNRIGTNTVISAVLGGGENRMADNIDGGIMGGGFRNDILGSDNPNQRQIAPVLFGGSDNEIGQSRGWGVVLGGDNNRIGPNANAATIIGGTNNLIAANAHLSFAAGRRCRVNHQGAWMWADSQNASYASAGEDTFNIRAQGGIHANADTSMFFGSTTRQMLNLFGDDYGLGVQSGTLYFRSNGTFSWFEEGTHSNSANTPGTGGTERMRLSSSGLRVNGTFVSASDKNKKENFRTLDPRAVLEKVAVLPVSEWNYKDDPGIRHVGPMAQDFHAAFQIGPDDKHIATVDADGVALAAIQGLNLKLAEKEGRIEKLEAELAALRSLVERTLEAKARP